MSSSLLAYFGLTHAQLPSAPELVRFEAHKKQIKALRALHEACEGEAHNASHRREWATQAVERATRKVLRRRAECLRMDEPAGVPTADAEEETRNRFASFVAEEPSFMEDSVDWSRVPVSVCDLLAVPAGNE